MARLWLGLTALSLAAAAVDHGMKLQQTLGSTIVVCAHRTLRVIDVAALRDVFFMPN